MLFLWKYRNLKLGMVLNCHKIYEDVDLDIRTDKLGKSFSVIVFYGNTNLHDMIISIKPSLSNICIFVPSFDGWGYG